MLALLSTIIGPDKIGGWVRSGVAALLGILIAKWPLLSQVLDPATQSAIGFAAAGIVVGLWSQVTKTEAAKVAMVDALAKDPESPVKGVVVESTLAGRDLKAANPGGAVVLAGTHDAQVIAGKPVGAN